MTDRLWATRLAEWIAWNHEEVESSIGAVYGDTTTIGGGLLNHLSGDGNGLTRVPASRLGKPNRFAWL